MLGGATAKTLRRGATACPRRPADRRRRSSSSFRPDGQTPTRSPRRSAARPRRPRTSRSSRGSERKGPPDALRRARAVSPSFPYPESAARALGRAAQRAEWLRRPAGTRAGSRRHRPRRAAHVVDRASRQATMSGLTPGDAPRCSSPTACRSCRAPRRDPDEPRSPRPELGFPVVVKTAAPGAHKTESGGVALDLARRRCGASGRRADRRPGDRPADGLAAARSCWPASSRTRSSGRWSPSAPVASSPS